jgi:polyvinyl alcohol dehydrogenase (cytochrome)
MKCLRMPCVGLFLLCCYSLAYAQSADWPMFGQNAANTANNPSETTISTANVSQLAPKWIFTTGGDVSARAAVVNGVAYFPDWGGNLWAVNAANGSLIWSRQLSDYGLPANTRSRTTPAVDKGILYLGTQDGAWLLAINTTTGALVWKTQLESPANDPFAIISTSPVVVGGTVYTGIASLEEGMAAFIPGFQCCKARGSVVAVQANNGKIKWQTYTTPAGYSGAGVWGSNLVVDAESNRVFVSTGNNYSRPKSSAKSSIPGTTYGACIAGGGTPASCNALDNYVDAIIALDTGNGKVKWDRKLVNWNQTAFGVIDGSDDWNVACIFPGINPTNCPTDAGPDYDFGSAPNLITYQTSKGPKTILGAGQKSGIYFALDPKTGATLWQTQVGPGSALGGMEWGSATDGKRIYVQIANFYGIPSPSGRSAGSWAALDPATGAVLWHKPDPNDATVLAPMTVANGVVYAHSMAGGPSAPTMFALDATTGNTLWSFASGASVNAGATVVKGTVFWGSGYTNLGIPGFTGNNKFYAFSLNGN